MFRNDGSDPQKVKSEMRACTILLLGVLIVLAYFSFEVEADKHEIIKKIVLKKIFKSLKRAKFVPIVVPFHLTKHENHGWESHGWEGGHEKYHVQEIGGHGGWNEW